VLILFYVFYIEVTLLKKVNEDIRKDNASDDSDNSYYDNKIITVRKRILNIQYIFSLCCFFSINLLRIELINI